jgi:hypothetical protein
MNGNGGMDVMARDRNIEGALARVRAGSVTCPVDVRSTDGPPYKRQIGSQYALAEEFLRRMAVWAQALHCPKWPFFSVAEKMAQMAQDTRGRTNPMNHPTLGSRPEILL